MSIGNQELQAETPAPRPRPRANPGRDLVIIFLLLVVAGIIAWHGGLFRPKPRIAVISSTDSVYWDPVFLGAQYAANQCGAELKIVRVKSADAQSQAIKDLQSQGINGFAISPIDANAQASFLSDLSGKSALVTMDSDCTAPIAQHLSARTIIEPANNARVGGAAIPDGGEIIISVGSVAKDNGRLRRQGLIDDLMERSLDSSRASDPLDAPLKGKKYSVVATLIDNVDPAKATSLVVDAIKQHPDVKCIVGLFGYSTPALLDGLKQADQLGKIKVVGFDNADATLAGIENGTVFGALVQDQFTMGFDSVMTLCQLINAGSHSQSVFKRGFLYCDTLTSAGREALSHAAAA